jgi:hypothetical protein
MMMKGVSRKKFSFQKTVIKMNQEAKLYSNMLFFGLIFLFGVGLVLEIAGTVNPRLIYTYTFLP